MRAHHLTLLAALASACITGGVTEPGVPLDLTLRFCPGEAPAYFAVQSENGPWTPIPIVNDAVVFRAGPRVTLAAVSPAGYYRRADFVFALATELAQIGTPDCPVVTGAREVTDTIKGLSAGQTADVFFGSRSIAFAADTTTAFTTTTAPDVPFDVVAMRHLTNPYRLSKIILWRGVDPASGSTLAPLDFSAADAWDPFLVHVSASESAYLTTLFVSPRNGSITLQQASGFSANLPLLGVGQGLLAGEMHSATASVIGLSSTRTVERYFADVKDPQLELASDLASATAHTIATAPYVRLSGQLPIQSDYPSFGYFSFKYEEPEEFAIVYSLVETRGFAGAGATTWDVTVPDLSAVAGFQTSWMMQPTQTSIDWSASAMSGSLNVRGHAFRSAEYRPWFLRGVPPRAGDVVRFATRQYPPSSLSP